MPRLDTAFVLVKYKPSAQERADNFAAIYTEYRQRLAAHPDGANMAAVAAWTAYYGRCASKIAREMQRGRPWVTQRLRALDEHLLRALESEQRAA